MSAYYCVFLYIFYIFSVYHSVLSKKWSFFILMHRKNIHAISFFSLILLLMRYIRYNSWLWRTFTDTFIWYTKKLWAKLFCCSEKIIYLFGGWAQKTIKYFAKGHLQDGPPWALWERPNSLIIYDGISEWRTPALIAPLKHK